MSRFQRIQIFSTFLDRHFSFAGLYQYIETCPLGVLVDSVEKDPVYTEINGTQGVYDVQRIAISDYIYAAKEVCGPIAYNGKGVTAAWLRIAKPAKMKK